VVFGTDYPYLRKDLAIKGKLRIQSNPDLSAEEKKQVFGGNALKLFQRFDTVKIDGK
jgi:predicted TIM-barrel fold metal-dependent hydrolase